jgi:hypothetical protein
MPTTKKNHNVPSPDELLYPTIESLRQLGGSGNAGEISEKLIATQQIPEKIVSVMHTVSMQTARTISKVGMTS